MRRYIIYVDAFNLQKAAAKYFPSTQGKFIALLWYIFFSLFKCMLLPAFFSPLLNASFSSHSLCYFLSSKNKGYHPNSNVSSLLVNKAAEWLLDK